MCKMLDETLSPLECLAIQLEVGDEQLSERDEGGGTEEDGKRTEFGRRLTYCERAARRRTRRRSLFQPMTSHLLLRDHAFAHAQFASDTVGSTTKVRRKGTRRWSMKRLFPSTRFAMRLASEAARATSW